MRDVAGSAQLSGQDALWLTMDRPNNLMVIDVVVVLDETPPLATLRALFTRLVARYPVFRCRAQRHHGSWRWVDDRDFDVDRHLGVVSLPEPAGMRQVQDYVAAQRSTPLDRDRPLWAATLLQHIELEDGSIGSVVVIRSHHAIADGVRLTQVLLAMLDPEHASDVPAVGRSGAGGSTSPFEAALALPGEALRVLGAMTQAAGTALGRMISAPADAAASTAASLPSGLGTIRHPDRLVDVLESLGADDHRAVNDLTTVGKLTLGGGDRTVWTGKPGTRKAVAWSTPLPLGPVKEAAHRRGVTLNDVMVAALAGALQHYLAGRGDHVDEVLWMVPVNLAPFSAELPEQLGNHFALVMLDMPLDGSSPELRIASIHQRMDRIKNSDEPLLTFGLQRAISLSPARMATLLTDFFANKAVGVLTNVPGPVGRLNLDGIGVRQVIGFAPCSGDQPLTATIFTYAGSVTVGFASDADLVPDPQTLVAEVCAELERIVAGSAE